jgi:hypothetical protein
MPDLQFEIESAEATRNAAVPQLTFKLRITNSEPEAIHSIALRAQVQIEPARRRYTPAERENLRELFGEHELWSKSLNPLLWTVSNIAVQAFTGSTVVDVPVPCTFDFNVAMTKYVHGLEGGQLPLEFLFSGTVFHAGRTGLQIAQIPWDRHACFFLAVSTWKEMMDAYYPNSAWLSLHRDVFERLYEYKRQHGLPTWERALEQLLGTAAEVK